MSLSPQAKAPRDKVMAFQHTGVAMGIPIGGIEGQNKSVEMSLLTN